MKQVLLLEGQAILEEVPAPSVEPGAVLVRTAYSVLSAGTERAVLHAQDAASILGRAADPSTLGRAICCAARGPDGCGSGSVRRAKDTRSLPGMPPAGS